MKFAPEYVTFVLNENFEDAKALLLSPMMAINYAHLVMLAAQGIVSPSDAHALREALDGVSQDAIRDVKYDGTYEDLFFYVERLIVQACGEDVAGRLHTARSRQSVHVWRSGRRRGPRWDLLFRRARRERGGQADHPDQHID